MKLKQPRTCHVRTRSRLDWSSTLLLIAIVATPVSGEVIHTAALAHDDDVARMAVNRGAWRDAWLAGRSVTLAGVRLGAETVDLLLEPFSVISDRTRFVVGRMEAPDVEWGRDRQRVSLWRGSLAGRPGTHVFIAEAEQFLTGSITLAGGSVYDLSSSDRDGNTLPAGEFTVFSAQPRGAAGPVVPCVTLDEPTAPGPGDLPNAIPDVTKQIELAIETDYEYFVLFNDIDAAADYVVALYGAVSDIYRRDVNAHITLTFVRIWDDPDDSINGSDPLSSFRGFWNAFMGAVPRDVAQFLSGRRDFPYGGAAYLSSLCSGNAYGVVGYVLGQFPDPSRPSTQHYDIAVTAHELGHNCAAAHTHNLGIDNCDDPETTAQRGSIMSYCAQTWSGGNALRDLYFHTGTRPDMIEHLEESECIADDCNLNAIDDLIEIANGEAPDSNSNGIPDGCEDCNDNGTLDPVDIATATSADINTNYIPDECEADCNGNDLPDDFDIAEGPSTDLYGNAVPDECEPDCNDNGTSDYSEIQIDMMLDIDRNAVPDDCQRCREGKLNDVEALAGAHDLWVASGLDAQPIKRFFASTGVLVRTSGVTVDQGMDVLVVAPDRVLVSSLAGDRVVEFDREGTYVRDLVPAGAGGLVGPTGLLALENSLLVASSGTDAILAYDLRSGEVQVPFVASGSSPLSAPFGLAAHAGTGHVFATSGDGRIMEYDTSGGFVRIVVDLDDNAGLAQPRGLLFKPDGNLLVASFGSNEVLEFDTPSGRPLGPFSQVGTGVVLNQVSPWGLRIGPNGNLYVSRTGPDYGSGGTPAPDGAGLHLSNVQIFEFDIRTGYFLRSHIGGNDHGLLFPTGFAFLPGWAADCNYNQLPDSCEVAGDGIPDECDVDCNDNGIFDRLDVVPYGAELDCNFNLSPDACDIAQDPGLDTNRNGVIDGCECLDFRVCADTDSDGIRDEGCTWWACETGTCVDTPIRFGDAGGPFGACPVDGVPDGNDHFHALNCFANDVDGLPYPCAFEPPTTLNVDIGGAFGGCAPDGVCDGNDAFHAVDAFGKISPCSCPLDGGPAPVITPVPGGTATIEIRPRRLLARPGEHVVVDIYLEAAPRALRGYQLHIAASGGKSGRLEVVDIAIDPAAAPRGTTDDAVPWTAFNVARGQMLAGVSAGTLATPRYLATFTFKTTPDAAGEFVIDVLADPADPAQRTFLFGSSMDRRIEIAARPAVMRIAAPQAGHTRGTVRR